MKNTISFNTKFGWISATEINKKITKIQFNKVKKTGTPSKNLKNLQRNFYSYLQGNKKTIKAPIIDDNEEYLKINDINSQVIPKIIPNLKDNANMIPK